MSPILVKRFKYVFNFVYKHLLFLLTIKLSPKLNAHKHNEKEKIKEMK